MPQTRAALQEDLGPFIKNLDSWEDLAMPCEELSHQRLDARSLEELQSSDDMAPDCWEEHGDEFGSEWHNAETASIATTSIATTLDETDESSVAAGSIDFDYSDAGDSADRRVHSED